MIRLSNYFSATLNLLCISVCVFFTIGFIGPVDRLGFFGVIRSTSWFVILVLMMFSAVIVYLIPYIKNSIYTSSIIGTSLYLILLLGDKAEFQIAIPTVITILYFILSVAAHAIWKSKLSATTAFFQHVLCVVGVTAVFIFGVFVQVFLIGIPLPT